MFRLNVNGELSKLICNNAIAQLLINIYLYQSNYASLEIGNLSLDRVNSSHLRLSFLYLIN